MRDLRDTIFHMKNSRGTSHAWLLGALSAAASGCYDPPISTERLEESIVITTHDEAADFGKFRTFFLRPEIRVLDETELESTTGEENPEAEAETEVLPANQAEPLLAATRQNLLDRGYREASTLANADLGVEVVYARTIQSDYYCYYWGDWAYWGYPGASYYYPYGCSGSAWQSGMLVTHSVDLAAAARDPSDELLRGVWYSGIYGVEAESSAFVVDRAAAGISQAFVQSPYFETTPVGGE